MINIQVQTPSRRVICVNNKYSTILTVTHIYENKLKLKYGR